MRLLHAASSYPLNASDSAAPFMEEMLRALADRNVDVTVVVPRMNGLIEGKRSGVTVVGAPYAPQKFQVWGYGKSLGADNRLRVSALAMAPSALTSMGLALRRQIRRNRPDVVHLHWVLPQGLLTAAVPEDIPVVVSAHGADARFARGRLRPIARRVLDRADALVAASAQILDLLSEVQPSIRRKSHVIPHGANAEVFTPMSRSDARLALGLDQDVHMVLAVGRLVSKKGFAPLIGSMRALADTNARLYIIGEGPDRKLLEGLTLKSEGQASLVGAQPRDMVSKWMAASDVVVVPSIADGHDVDSGPVVLMEALAAGRPVVASRTGMAPDVIKDDINGFLLPSTTPESIAAAVRRAIAESDLLGHGARETFESIGDWNRVAQELQAVYESVVSTSRNSSRT